MQIFSRTFNVLLTWKIFCPKYSAFISSNYREGIHLHLHAVLKIIILFINSGILYFKLIIIIIIFLPNVTFFLD